ncbi:MAG: glutathione S-transferase family protein [Pseudomonadales bacterium]
MVQLLEQDIKTKEVLDWQGVHLIHFSGSSCSQKTRIFLNLKGIAWESHPLNLVAQDNYKPWFLGINPRGLVPVLVHNGVVHIESNDILQYLDDTFPTPKLIPDSQRTGIIDGLKEEDDLHLDVRTLTMRFVLPKFLAQKKPAALQAFEQDAGTIEGAKDPHKEVELEFWNNYAKHGVTDEQASQAANNFRAVYERFEKVLNMTPYLQGQTLTLLDIAWFIYTHRLASAGYPFRRLHPRVFDWYRNLLDRPDFSKEVASPPPLKLVSGALHLVQRLKGATLSNVSGF